MRNFFAMSMTKFFRFMADTFFAKRYGHRAVVLETVAGVPGMVAGMMLHFKSLRKMKTGYGPDIREMLAEAENERMHMIFYAVLYAIDFKTAHRMIGYFEEEAVKSYTEYLALVESGDVENVPAPELAIKYYKMKKNAKLSDLIIKVRADEMHHSEVNHKYADGDTSYRRKNG